MRLVVRKRVRCGFDPLGCSGYGLRAGFTSIASQTVVALNVGAQTDTLQTPCSPDERGRLVNHMIHSGVQAVILIALGKIAILALMGNHAARSARNAKNRFGELIDTAHAMPVTIKHATWSSLCSRPSSTRAS